MLFSKIIKLKKDDIIYKKEDFRKKDQKLFEFIKSKSIMITELSPKIIEAFDRVRKIYFLQGFERISKETKNILKSNLKNEEYLMDIKSTIELIIESQYEEKLTEFDEFFILPHLKEELALIHTYLIDLLKGDPDVENLKCFIIFNPKTGIVRFGWNHQIFKKDIDLVAGLFTAITSFSKEAIERQLKGLSVEGMEFQMISFKKCDIAILYILERDPSPLLIKRLNIFATELENEFLELFGTMDFIDFTDDKEVREKMYKIMVNILRFDYKKLAKKDNHKE